MSSLRLHGEECVATLWEAKGPTDPIDGPILVPSLLKFDGTVELADAMPRWEPFPEPKPNRPDEFWWVQWHGDDTPLETAQISFEGDTPSKIHSIGDDSWGRSIAESDVRLVERILPPGRVAEVAAKLRESFDAREDEAHWAIIEQAIELLGQPKEG